MKNWAGQKITKGEKYYWTNWQLGKQSIALVDDYSVPEEWLDDIFDSSKSGYLMPMAIELWN